MALTASTHASTVFLEALENGCSPGDCQQAYNLALEGIPAIPADEDYGPNHLETNDCY